MRIVHDDQGPITPEMYESIKKYMSSPIDRAIAVMKAAIELREAESVEHPDMMEQARILSAQCDLIDATDAILPTDIDDLTDLLNPPNLAYPTDPAKAWRLFVHKSEQETTR